MRSGAGLLLALGAAGVLLLHLLLLLRRARRALPMSTAARGRGSPGAEPAGGAPEAQNGAGPGRAEALQVSRPEPRCLRRAGLVEPTDAAEGKAVLITGCDKGFGHALAKCLHAKGFTVFAGCLLMDENGDGARELRNMKSDRMKVLQMDVCSDQEVAQAVDFVKRTLQEPEEGLWGLVNNAGISTFGEVEFASLDNYKKVAEVNLWGTVRVTKAFLPLIRRAKGRVVNITSMLGRMASPSRSCYCVSKFGVAAFSDCLRQEMYRWGVRVVLVEPSNFVAATGILTAAGVDRQAQALWSGASLAVRQDYGSEHFARHVATMKSFVSSGLKDMSLVLNAITEALTSPCPRNRYNPMEMYWWVRLQVMTHLPTAIADWLYIPGATL